MLNSWSQSLSGSPETSPQILSQFLWFNKYLKSEDAVIHFPKFSNKGINFLSQLLKMAGPYLGSILTINMN